MVFMAGTPGSRLLRVKLAVTINSRGRVVQIDSDSDRPNIFSQNPEGGSSVYETHPPHRHELIVRQRVVSQVMECPRARFLLIFSSGVK